MYIDRWVWGVLSLAFVVFLRMLGIFLVIPVFSLGTLKEYSGANEFLAGVALGGYAITQALSQFPLGWLSDKVGRKIALIIGLLIFATGGLWAYFTKTIEGLIVARLVQGMGGVSSVVMAAMGDLAPEKYRARAYMLGGMAIGSAIFIGIILGGYLYDALGFRMLFLLLALLSFLGVIIAFLLPNKAKSKNTALNNESQLTLKKVYELISPALYIAFLLTLIMQVYFFVFPLELERLGVRRAGITALIMIPSVLVYPLIHFSEKHGRIHIAYVLGYVLIVLSGMVYVMGYSDWLPLIAVIGGTTIYLMGYSVYQPLLPSFISLRVGEERRGVAMAMYNFIAYGGMAIGGPVAGLIMQKASEYIWLVPIVVSIFLVVPLRKILLTIREA